MADKPADKAQKQRQRQIADTIAKYAYFNYLIETFPELQGFFDQLKATVQKSPTGQITQDEFNALTRGVGFFEDLDSKQQRAEIERAQDRQNNTNLYGESVAELKRVIGQQAAKAGLELSDEILTQLAEQSRYNGWDAVQTQQALGEQIQKAASAGQDLRGSAGSVQVELSDWARRNGLNLTPEQLAPFISRGATGMQSLEDAKAELRKTYLVGMFPAWSERIAAGLDPEFLFKPHINSVANVLEDPTIDFSDPLVKQITQAVGPDGKPYAMPIYEAEALARKDARWLKTDNAFDTVSRIADDLRRMWGLG